MPLNDRNLKFPSPNLILAIYIYIFVALLFIFSLKVMGASLPGPIEILLNDLPFLLSFLSATVIVFHVFIPKEDKDAALSEIALFTGVVTGFISATMVAMSLDNWVGLVASIIAAPLLIYLFRRVEGILPYILSLAATAVVVAITAGLYSYFIAPSQNTFCLILLVGVTASIALITSQYVLRKIGERLGRPR